jgi:hypothetical protein
MFVVKWSPSAMNDFATLTVLHPNRWKDINAADNDIDHKLRTDPMHYGHHLSEGLWCIISVPLAVYYSIDGNVINVTSCAWVE